METAKAFIRGPLLLVLLVLLRKSLLLKPFYYGMRCSM
jgi:hypothetical protein